MAAERATKWKRLAGLLVVAVLAGCAKGYIQEPWTGGPGEQAKEKWESPRTPQQLDQLRNRLMTSQTDR